jgi:hypothetical protein
MGIGLVSFFAVALAVSADPTPSTGPDTMVLCPNEFRAALEPWLDYRRAQGHKIVVEEPADTSRGILEQIKNESGRSRLKNVVLIGDSPEQGPRNGGRASSRLTSTCFVRGEINEMLGESTPIASDAPYADIDGDGSPDLCLGRISVDTPAELTTFVNKTIRYETRLDHGLWRRRINLVAGVGDFGPVADKLIENATRACIVGRVPGGFDTCMTYGSWRSPYVPNPERFQETCLARLNEGSLFWVYIGHGSPRACDSVRHHGKFFPILRARDCDELNAVAGSPVALFFCCYTGAYDQPNDCLAEEMLRKENGPVAAIASSRISLPYSLALFGRGLIEEYFHGDGETLGELVRRAKVRLKNHQSVIPESGELPEDATPEERLTAVIDSAAALISPSGDRLDTEREEHVALLNLLGDPLLRITRSQSADVELPKAKIAPGERLSIKVVSPIAGKGRIELTCRRGNTKEAIPLRKLEELSPKHFDQLHAEYEKAIDTVWSRSESKIQHGNNLIELAVPPEIRGPLQVRVFVEGEKGHAIGVADADTQSSD